MGHNTAVKQRNDKSLHALVGSMADAMQSTFGSVVGREVRATVEGSIGLQGPGEWANVPGSMTSITANLQGDVEGRCVVLIECADAIATAALKSGASDEEVEERRGAGVLAGDDLATFGGIANDLCTGIGEVLASYDRVSTSMEFDGYGPFEPSQLGDQAIEPYALELTIGDYPPATAYIVFNASAAEKLNGEPLDEGSQEEAPAAPVVGKLAAFMARMETYEAVRESCRRVGLEIVRYRRTDVPNPAAHKGAIVLLEISVGEERRFDWAKRLKEQQPECKVVILLHAPSRNRVVQGFMTKADAIVAWPGTEQQLSAKLKSLLPLD